MPEDNSLLGDDTGEEDMYEKDAYLEDFEKLLIPNDEISGEISHFGLIIENNSNRFGVQ